MTETVPGLTPEAPPAPLVNLATNPSFETASGVVEVRRNTIFTPNARTSATGWTSNNGSVFVGSWGSGLGADGAGCYIQTRSATTPDDRLASLYLLNPGGLLANKVTPGTLIQGRISVRLDAAGRKTHAYLAFRDAAGTVVLSVAGKTTVSPAPVGQWIELVTDVVTVPANADSVFIVAEAHSLVGNVPAGEVSRWNLGYVGAPGPYFDGSTPAAGDFTYVWVGTPDNSASVQRGLGVSGASTGIQSGEWASSGARSIRVVPLGTSTDTYTAVGGDVGAMRLGMVAGRTYTVLARARLDRALTGPIAPSARSIRFFYKIGTSYLAIQSTAAPNTPGVYDARLTFTVPDAATEAFIRLMNGAARNGGDVWWDDFLIVEGEYDGPYFDGDSAIEPIAGSPNRHAYAWEGNPHASRTIRTSAGPSAWAREWWESLPLAYRVAERDEVGGYPLMRYMDGAGSIAGRIQGIINDMWDGAYTDPARVPDGKPLRWLAMLLGIKSYGDDADLRARMLELVSAGRSPAGTRAAIADATRPYLLGSRQVQVAPDKAVPNKIIVQVRADEVPPAGLAWVAAQVQRAGVAPAGHQVVLVAATSTWDAWSADAGTTWDQKEVNIPTWIASDSAGVSLE